MLAKLKRLEQAASALDPNTEQCFLLAGEVQAYLQDYVSHLHQSKTYTPDTATSETYQELAIHEKGSEIQEVIEIINKDIVAPGLNISAPNFFGYVPGGGLFPSALGDYIAAVTNLFAGAFFVSPGATRLENILIQWMCRLVGYPKAAGGNLSSGGSLANFIGIVAAREMFGLRSCLFHKAVIYLSSQTHHSIIKALRIAGLQEAVIRILPVDKDYRMQADMLQDAIREDKKRHLIPWLVVATAGTTNTGSIDPLQEIAAVCNQQQLWLHIDAAYGGFFNLCQSMKKTLAGMKEADSITIDPHKSLFIPYGLGVILTRSQVSLLHTYHYDEVDYLPSIDNHLEPSPASMSPELSKHFRALRLWMPLKLFGLKPFRAALDEKLLLAKFVYQKLLELPGIELACEPELSIVVFRYHPPVGDINEFNQLLSENIKHEGKVFFSTTYLDKNLYIRMAILNFRTHHDAVLQALDVIKHSIESLIKN